VLEVGLGGRLDATNVVDDKDVCIVGPIEMEHAAILGDTPAKIAAEKAAIIRPGSAVVMGVQPYAEAAEVIREVAKGADARFTEVAKAYEWQLLEWDAKGQTFSLSGPGWTRELRIPLLGGHQIENTASAVAAVEALRARGAIITEEALAKGLAVTHWPGRLEVVRERPLVVLDGAHTQEAATRVRQSLGRYFTFERAIFVAGFSEDKDLTAIAAALQPVISQVITTRSRHPRAIDPSIASAAFQTLNIEVTVVEEVAQAMDKGVALAGPNDLVCVLGSIFVAAEAREHLLGLAATV
jgi:dihydrofolate synthase/folylpolyglutamate synthase